MRRTPSVTACTLIVAPEMLRISFPTRSESPALLPRNWRRQGSYATSPPYGSRYTRISTSLRRSTGSMATRKVIGWSLPSTFPMAAKPSRESARDTRSTLTVSTRNVSARAPAPNTRAIEAATFAGGAAGDCAASRSSASAMLTSELVADAEAQHFELAHAGRVAQQLVVALERGVPGGFVGEAERRDAARQRAVPRHAGGDARLGVVTLVPEERVELLGGRRSDEAHQIVGPFDIAARDAAADGLRVGGVDCLGVAHADVRDHGAQRERSAVVACVRRDERHRRPEGPGADRGIRVRRAAIPE